VYTNMAEITDFSSSDFCFFAPCTNILTYLLKMKKQLKQSITQCEIFVTSWRMKR